MSSTFRSSCGSRIGDLDLEHEAIDLGLGQGIRSLLLDRVLRGHDQEQALQGEGLLADGHLPLLHGLQQGRLDFRGGTIDFVGQDEVGEDRALAGPKRAFAGHIDHRADKVCRQQVGGELDALEAGREGLGQRLDGRGLRQPRHSLQEDMPVGEQPHQEAGNHLLLPDDRLAQFALEAMDEVRLFRDAVFDLLDVHLHGWSPAGCRSKTKMSILIECH